MKLFNNHTHTRNSHDSNADIVDICESALQNGLFGFAVSDHCDCEYSSDPEVRKGVLNSFSDSEKAKELYNGKLIISSGVEIGEALFAPEFAAKIIDSAEWDMINGSVHAVRLPDWNMPFSVINFSDKDDKFIDKYLTAYFNDVLEMASTTDYDVLCHLTVPLRYIIKKYGKKVDITKYYPVTEQILKEVIKRNKVLEINTSNFLQEDPFFMPDEDIIDMYLSSGGKLFTIGSDAHIADNIAIGLDNAALMLKQKGINELTYFIDRKPVNYQI